MNVMLATLVVVVFLGVLQVHLDRREKLRTAKPGLEFWLHMGTGINGPVVLDHLGRRLRGVRHVLYSAKLDHVDTIRLEVLAHDGEGYFVNGRVGRKGPRP